MGPDPSCDLYESSIPMITFKPGEVSVVFDGGVAVSGARLNDKFWLIFRSLKIKKTPGEKILGDEEFGPEVTLTFTDPKSVQVLIDQLQKLKIIMEGGKIEENIFQRSPL